METEYFDNFKMLQALGWEAQEYTNFAAPQIDENNNLSIRFRHNKTREVIDIPANLIYDLIKLMKFIQNERANRTFTATF